MLDLLRVAFSVESFIPHGHCYLWKTGLVGLHVTADAFIALAYYSIPVALFYFVRQRQDLPFKQIFWLFGLFIILCGTTHLLEIWTLWYPTYWLSGGVKAFTALISVLTALELLPLIPQILAFPSPAELRRLNEELQISQARFAGILDTASDAIISINTNQSITLFNRAAEKMFGYTADNVLGQPLDRLLPQQVVGLHDRYVSVFKEKAENTWLMGERGEIFGRRQDGSEFPAEASISKLEVAGEKTFTAFIRDVSERKRAEAELQAQQQFLRQVIDTAPNLIFVKDWEGKFTLANQALAETYNTTVEAIIGKTDVDFCLDPTDPEQYARADQQVMQTLQPLVNLEESFTTPEGTIRWFQATKTPLVAADGQSRYVLGVANDITTLKHIEAALQQKTDELEGFFSSTIDLLCIANTDGYFVRLNPEWGRTLGYCLQDLEGKRFLDFVHPNDLQETLIALAQLSQQQSISSFVNRYRHQDGSYRWLEWRSVPRGNYIYAAARDITERKRIEATLQLVDFSFESSSTSSAWIRPDASIMRVNAAACELLGYSREELQSMHVYDLDPNFPVEQWTAHWQELKQQKHLSFVTQQLTKDGRLLPVEVTLNYVEFDGEAYNFASMQDISARLQAEAELRESEERFRSAFVYSAIGMALISLDGRWLKVNSAMCDIIGYNKEELFALTFQTITHPDDLETDLAYANQLLSGEIRSYQMEKRYFHKQGHLVWILLNGSLVRNSQNEPLYFVAQVQDITDRKAAEAALRASEERWRYSLEGNGDGLWDWDAQTNEVFFSRQWKAMLGFAEDEIGNDLSEWDKRVHPDDKAAVYAAIEQHFSGEVPHYVSEHRVLCKDGTYKWILDRGMVMSRDENGKPLRVIGTHTDISVRKQAEEKLRQSENTKRAMIQTIPDLLIRMRDDGTQLELINHGCVHLLVGEDTFVGSNITNLMPFEIAHERLHYAEQALKTGEVQIHEYQLAIDGHHYYEEARIVPLQENEVLMMIRDITDRKQMEHALRESENRFRSLIKDLQVGVIVHGKQSEILLSNSKALDLLGLTEAQLMGKTSFDPAWNVIHEDGSPFPGETHPVPQAIATRHSVRNVIMGVYRPKQNNRVWLLVDAEPQRDEAGNVQQVVCTFSDISDRQAALRERERAEAELQQREREFRALVENAPDIIMRLDYDCRYLYINPTVERHSGVPASAFINKTIEEFGPPETLIDLWRANIHRTFETGQEQRLEFEISSETGTIYYATRVVPEFANDGSVQSVLAIARDISDYVRILQERERAEERLRRYERIVAAATDAISLIDRNYVYQVVNQAYLDWHDKTDDQVVEHTVSEIVGEVGFEQIKEQIDRCLAGELVQDELWVEYPKLGLQFISVTYAPYLEPDQTISGVVVSLRNLTELQQAEEQLRQSEERLRLALKAAKFGTWEYQFAREELFQSDISEIYGLEPGQTHKTYAEWQAQVHPDDRDWVQADFEQVIQRAGESGEFSNEYRIIRPDGTVRWVLSTGAVVHDPVGQPLYAYGIAADITDRKLAEVEQKTQQAFLRQVIDIAPNNIFVKNREGKLLITNQAGAAMHGTTVEAMLGKRETDFNSNFSEEQLQEFLKTNQQVMQTRQPYTNLSQLVITSTGEVRWYQTVINPLIDGQGEVTGVVGATTDVTNLKLAEQALQQAKEAAEAANKAKSIFLANMSHELRTPLNVILGFAQVMYRDEGLTPDQRENLRIIRRSGDHLLSLINDVLDLSKIEAGHITLDASSIDLIDLLHSLEQMFHQRAEVKGLRLSLELASDLPQYVVIDANKLRQVLINLLGNAIKFTQEGSVTLRVLLATDHWSLSQITKYEAETILAFEVIDTGVGIAPSELESIFSAFVQTQAGKISPDGTGLGLTISQKFVQMMGGDITVHSTLGQGSTFAFKLPVEWAQSADACTTSLGQVIGLAPGQATYRILVVDDQSENRKLLVKLLAQIGLEVREATNGQEAVAQWQHWQPDLIYMDIRMPVLNGYEATQQIRATPNGHLPIIIALTARASRGDRILALSAGCNDYLSKPFQEEALFSKMAEYLGLQYICADNSANSLDEESLNAPITLKPDDFAIMPPDWVAALRQSARLCDDSDIEQLIEHIPAEHTCLIQGLRQLVQNYNFKQIVVLTTPEATDEDA